MTESEVDSERLQRRVVAVLDVGLYASDSTLSATGYHALDVVFAAVPKHSFLAVPMVD